MTFCSFFPTFSAQKKEYVSLKLDVLALFLLLCLVVVPHITDAVQEWVMNQAKVPVDDDKKEPQICVIEASIKPLR